MKAVIPVAGIGAKLRPHTHTQPKTLVPIAGKAILGHIIDDILSNGIKDFVFVVGYLSEKVEEYVKSHYGNRINAEFVLQEPREGSAHAIWVARHQIEKEKEILIVLGDTIAHVDFKAFLSSKYSVLGISKVATPSLFGIVETDDSGKAIKLIEKPKIPKSNLGLVGVYKIKNISLLLESIEYLMNKKHKNHGEYHLTDALMRMMEQGNILMTQAVEHWYDCGKKETLLEANAILLNKDEFKKDFPTNFIRTIIIPPVSIGKNCQIQNSIIGPNVAIGDNTILNKSIVENSIIGSFSELESVVLKDSIIGNDTSLKGLSQSLNIGDNTEINFMK
jgi:glucose-1-phosphate thymidylyltransferase